MPLREWMEQHGHPGWYSWLVVVGTQLVGSALILIITLNNTQRSIEADQRSREMSRQATCAVVIVQDDAFRDPSALPQTPAGKNAAEAWHNLRTVLHCDER